MMSRFCKICSHNHINYADSPSEFDIVCKVCGQDITKKEVLKEENARVIELLKSQKATGNKENDVNTSEEKTGSSFFLKDLESGIEISIPKGGAIFGRNSLGKEILSDEHISREHIKITINERRQTVSVEDISRYNVTMHNGKRMEYGPAGKRLLKNMDKLTLYNKELIFIKGTTVEEA